MAGEVQLKLGIGLDLNFFRQEMRKAVNIAQSEFTANLAVKIDRRKLNAELDNLQRAIRRRVYRIEIGGNLDAVPGRIDSIKKGLGELDGKKIDVKLSPITKEEVRDFKSAIKTALSGIKIKVGVEPSTTGGTATAASGARRPSYLDSPAYQSELQKIAKANANQLAKAVAGLREGRSKQELERLLSEFQAQNPQGASRSSALQAIRQNIAVAKYQQGLGIEARMGGPDPNRRGPFPNIAKTGPIETSYLMRESLAKAAQIDKRNAEIARQAAEMAAQMQSLRAASSRLLPPAADFGGTSARQSAVEGFYRRLQEANNMFARNFSANSYLPRATRQLADAMTTAASTLKALPAGRRIAGALPSSEMLNVRGIKDAISRRQFQESMRRAVEVDMRNAMRQQMEGRMLPAAGQTSYRTPQQIEQGKFRAAAEKAAAIDARYAARELIKNVREEMARGLLPGAGQTGGTAALRSELGGQQFRAPRIGGPADSALSQSGPIADRLRQAATQFAKNAPAVLKYLNLFSTAGGIDISDLPAANETPGQYIRRIQKALDQELKQGRFGAGTVPPSQPGFAFGGGPQLPGYPLQLALPPAGMTTAAGGPNYPYDRVRGSGGDGGGGGRGGAMVPYAPRTELPGSYLELGKMSSALREADKYLKQAKVPLAGAIQELGGEFGYAVQQVLLFGTAYKALAFFMDLPRQAFDASKALQTFNNQLNALTGSAAAADRASSFVSSVVDQFSVPLESARQGFVKLYASMEPAGIPTQTIEGLFVGVSKAAATLGLSADQVDRVNYAFSQMASKGQIMSEEVSGQLGDVIPGALSIMAEAAGLSLSEFKVAMEKGQLSGKALEQVFANLSIVLEDRFGAGARGAADTLQGVVNQMSTAMTRLYESFEPIVAAGVKAFGPDIIQLITDATSAVQAFSAAMAGNSGPANMLDSNAKNIYNVLLQLQEVFKALGSLIEGIAPTFLGFGRIILTISEYLAKFINTPVGEFLANIVSNAALATAAFVLLARSGILVAASALINLIRGVQLTITQLRVLSVTARATRIAMGGLIAGGILVGLEMLAEAISNSANQAERLRKNAIAAKDALRNMSVTELLAEKRRTEQQIALARKLQQQRTFSSADIKAAEAAGIPMTGRAGQRRPEKMMIEGYIQGREDYLANIRQSERNLDGTTASTPLTPVELQAGKDKGKKGKTKSLDDLIGGDIKRRMDEAKAGLGLDVARRMGAVGESEQAQRMVKFYEKYRNIALELSAVQETIQAIEKQRPTLVKLGIDPAEKIADLKSKERELAFDLAEASQLQYNESVKYYKEQQSLQKDFTRELEDIRIENGLIPEEQAKQIKLARQYEEIITKYPFLTEQQKLALRAAIYAQAEDTNSLTEKIKELKKELQDLTSTQTMVKTGAEAIGSSFAQSFKDVISGAQTAQQAMANFFQRIADSFLDMAAQMIQKWIQMQIIGLVQSLLTPLAGGLWTAGMSGGFSTGSAFSMAPGSVPAAGGISMPSFAGGISGGITGFATGGVVTGPTLGLVGEGRFNEAVVPLPDGKSIPVDLGGAGNNISTNIVINVNNGQAQSSSSGGASDLGRKMEGAVKQVIVNELRPGGLLSGGRR